MKRAFTILELLVVIGIIGIMMSVLVVSVTGGTESARAAKCLANLKSLSNGVQVYGGAYNHYPLAGSVEVMGFDESQGIRNVKKRFNERKGWISWNSNGAYRNSPQSSVANGGWMTSAYDPNIDSREYCLTNGAIWAGMSGSATCYRCPNHQKKMPGLGPNWSYVMNAYFGCHSDRHKTRDENYWGIRFDSLKRADKRLLFAELQWENLKGQTAPQPSPSSGAAFDCVLQYDQDGQHEKIGFNHKSGRDMCAHVVFADGHIEKLIWKPNQDLQQLTRWLCEGRDVALSNSSGRYEEVK